MSERKKLSKDQEKEALEAFGQKVKAAQDAHAPEVEEDVTGWAVGIRYASDFTAAIIAGALLGLGFDKFAHTTPWGVLIGTTLGFTAAVRNIIRTAKKFSIDESES